MNGEELKSPHSMLSKDSQCNGPKQ